MPHDRCLETTYDLPWDVSTRDIYMDRVPVYGERDWEPLGYRARWNLPYSLAPIVGAQMGWGGDQIGCFVAAVNILDRYVPAGPGDQAQYYGVALPCRQLVIRMAPGFADRFLRPITWWGGRIEGAAILRWIARNRAEWEEAGIDLALPDGGGSTLIV